jgi:hypothetical protein
MRLKNYGRGTCGCCSGDTRPVYGSPRDVTHRLYCAPCWNTMGVAPTSDNPWADDNPLDVTQARAARGWKALTA